MTEAAAVEKTEETSTEQQTDVEKQAFLDRLNKESSKRKEAETQAAEARKEVETLRAQFEAAKDEKLPEVEQLKKQLEKAQKDAEQSVKDAVDAATTKARAERLVLAAASKAGFEDPDDAFRFPEHVDLSTIEDGDAAERAIGKLAKAKPRLLKDTEQVLPGKVLAGGRKAEPGKPDIDLDAEAQMVSDNLKKFLASRQQS